MKEYKESVWDKTKKHGGRILGISFLMFSSYIPGDGWSSPVSGAAAMLGLIAIAAIIYVISGAANS